MNEVKRVNPIRVAVEKLLKNKLAVVCFVVLVVEIIMVILAPWIAPYSYEEQDPSIRLFPCWWALSPPPWAFSSAPSAACWPPITPSWTIPSCG